MHFQFLVEDASGEELIRVLMRKVESTYPVTYDVKSFKGLGGFTPKNTVKETKTGKLLNDLATYLRGFNKSFAGYRATVFIVLDNDTRDTNQFRQELQHVAQENRITIDHVFCIAVEEMEAWLLGDREAIRTAYPHARISLLSGYTQDSICGTWEFLADVVYPDGLPAFKRENRQFYEIGSMKAKWASEIGIHMHLHENSSPSFKEFIEEMTRRLPTV